jgi:RNA polymerase sigma-70 factor, ECF subfamily
MSDLKPFIKQFKKKDYQAFDTFYQLTKKQVFFSIITIIKDENLVEDIMQDAYLKFLNSIDKVNDSKNVVAYLSRIARNLAIDLYNERKKEIYSEEVFENLLDEDTYDEEQQEDILKMLDLLDSTEKEIITLHVINELKFREISDMMEKPLGTVLWIYQKGIKKLKEKVGEYR